MDKIDLKKLYRELYNVGKKAVKPHFVDVPALQYVMVDGRGDPNTSEQYQNAIGALYGVAYTVKFVAKGSGSDFGVMPLEGLWWSAPPEEFATTPKSEWLWTAMILQPDFITKNMVDDAIATGIKKGNIDPDTAKKVRLEKLEEGKAGQVLHIGPYSAEAPTIQALHDHIETHDYILYGKHHEIYMSDPRRVAQENLKTIIRHPVTKKRLPGE